MRDVQDIVNYFDQYRIRVYDSGAVKGPIVYPTKNYNGNQAIKQQRADSVGTPPVGGEFVLPTNYSAFRFKSTPRAYSLSYRASTSTVTEYGISGTKFVSHRVVDYGTTGAPDYFPAVPERVINRCRIKVQKALRGEGNMNVGQTLGEMPETVDFIADTFMTVLNAMKATLKGEFAKAAGILGVNTIPRSKDAATAWLSMQYGWKPLLADIHDAAALLSDGIQRDPDLSVIRIAKDTDFDVANMPPLSAQWVINAKNASSSRGVEIGVTYGIRNPWLYDLTRLGLTNPAAVAWELVPLSFVADWFVPIGSFIESLTFPIGLVFKHGYMSTFVNWEAQLEHYYAPNPGTGTFRSCDAQLRASRREVIGYFDLIVTPVWDPRLNLSKYASLAALTRVLFGS